MGPSTRYRLAADDSIAWVDDDFRAFARANDAPELVDGVVGRSLFDFVDGLVVTELWRLLLGRVRSSGTPVELPFRCDSPGLRRYMAVRLSPREGGEVDFLSKVMRMEWREPVGLLGRDRRGGSGDELVRVCSWCCRVAAPEWVEVETAAERLRLLEESYVVALTHGICDRCVAEVADVARKLPASAAC
jgi:hypothetical protein